MDGERSFVVGGRRLTVCSTAGFCFGVGRAVEMALEHSSEGAESPVLYTVGPLVHNRHVLETLRLRGVMDAGDISGVPEDMPVMIRSHGASRELFDALRGRSVTDATCPCVALIHKAVQTESERHILLFGDPKHPEVRATASWCRSVSVFESLESLEKLSRENPGWNMIPLAAVAQTTANLKIWKKCILFLKMHYTNIKILDTICRATSLRQQEAVELSRKADVIIVVGDKKSSNTKNLAGICENSVLLDSAEELDTRDFMCYTHIGITAGASTPAAIIEEVILKMTEEMMNADKAAGVAETEPPAQAKSSDVTAGDGAASAEAPAETIQESGASAAEAKENEGDASFAELLESSLKTLTTGEKVVGVITGITPAEIQVDLGTKHAGYIPVEELGDEQPEKIAEALRVGDEIETFVVRVNDVEGTAMLSKKRLDTVKIWETVEGARETRQVFEGVVIEENKGGVVVSVKGVRIFVPSSQTGLGSDVPLSSLLKTRVRLRVTEFNRARRRVVGSIRAVLQEERRSQSEAVWENIETGKVYKGIVKSLTSYGAFVDIGGVDGMVHVSELSWGRIRQPADILKIGDQIEVFVLSFDKEKRKISLGHRKAEDNPWNKVVSTYSIGDTLQVKVIKLMPFGVFCEVIPGVDGLIHISQLSDHRIVKPSDVVSEGDVVTVKLVDINMEKKKLSLSIRAIMEETVVPEEDGGVGEDEIVASSGEVTAVKSEAIQTAESGTSEEEGSTVVSQLDGIAGAVADAVAEVAREDAADQAAKAEIPKKTRKKSASAATSEDAPAEEGAPSAQESEPLKKSAQPKKKSESSEPENTPEPEDAPAKKRSAPKKKSAPVESAE